MLNKSSIASGVTSTLGILLCFAHCHAAFVQATPPANSPPQQTLLFTPSTLSPSRLSGLWEAPDGRGGKIGLHLLLMTTAPAGATTLAGVPQRWQSLSIGLYDWPETGLRFGDENFFTGFLFGGSAPGDALYRDGRLTMHMPNYDLDLTRLSGDRWIGRIHRLDIDRTLVLSRPGGLEKVAQTGLAGTWLLDRGALQSCLHIRQRSAGRYIGWSDQIQLMGHIRYPPNVAHFKDTSESYGNIATVESFPAGHALVVLYAYTGICCSQTFAATLDHDSKTMRAYWGAGQTHDPRMQIWRKMPGDSCVPGGPLTQPPTTPSKREQKGCPTSRF